MVALAKIGLLINLILRHCICPAFAESSARAMLRHAATLDFPTPVEEQRNRVCYIPFPDLDMLRIYLAAVEESP